MPTNNGNSQPLSTTAELVDNNHSWTVGRGSESTLDVGASFRCDCEDQRCGWLCGKKYGYFVSTVFFIKDTVQFWIFFAHSMQIWMGFRKPPLKMVLKQEFSLYSFFALASCLFGQSVRKSCAFCTGATTSVAPPLHQLHFRLVYSWCIKLQCASITSHSHLHTHKFHLTQKRRGYWRTSTGGGGAILPPPL